MTPRAEQNRGITSGNVLREYQVKKTTQLRLEVQLVQRCLLHVTLSLTPFEIQEHNIWQPYALIIMDRQLLGLYLNFNASQKLSILIQVFLVTTAQQNTNLA